MCPRERGEKGSVSTDLAAGTVPRVPEVSIQERGADHLIGSCPVLRPGRCGRCDGASHGQPCSREKALSSAGQGSGIRGQGECVREVNGGKETTID